MEAELSRQLPAEHVRQAVARIRRDRPGGGQDQGLPRGRGRARRPGGADRRSQDRSRDARDGGRRAPRARRQARADGRGAAAFAAAQGCDGRAQRHRRNPRRHRRRRGLAVRRRPVPHVRAFCRAAGLDRPKSSPSPRAPRAASRKSSPRSGAAGRSPG